MREQSKYPNTIYIGINAILALHTGNVLGICIGRYLGIPGMGFVELFVFVKRTVKLSIEPGGVRGHQFLRFDDPRGPEENVKNLLRNARALVYAPHDVIGMKSLEGLGFLLCCRPCGGKPLLRVLTVEEFFLRPHELIAKYRQHLPVPL